MSLARRLRSALKLDVGLPGDLDPLLSVRSDELGEFGGRCRKHSSHPDVAGAEAWEIKVRRSSGAATQGSQTAVVRPACEPTTASGTESVEAK